LLTAIAGTLEDAKREAGTALPRCRREWTLPSARLSASWCCRCFGPKVQRSASYVVWATPTHPSRPWAVGHEIRPGCLKVVTFADSNMQAH
jgi:hypothetical protein